MNIEIYVINLDRAVERWNRFSLQAQAAGVKPVRIAAVDGRAIAPRDRVEVDEPKFRRRNGRSIVAGEYGCYRSHIIALEHFVDSGAEIGLIMEDDAELDSQLIERCLAIHRAIPHAGLVKLLNHRTRGFVARKRTALGDVLGRCLHGPLGSGACYLVTQAGAKGLLASTRTMSLPYDIALERGWATGVRTYTTKNNATVLGPLRKDTDIAHARHYRELKLPPYMRIPTYLFRTIEFSNRLIYALWIFK